MRRVVLLHGRILWVAAGVLGCSGGAVPANPEHVSLRSGEQGAGGPACAGLHSSTGKESDMSTGAAAVRATLTIEDPCVRSGRDLKMRLTIANTSGEPVSIDTWYVWSEVLMLKVRSLDGTPALPGPPPTPTANEGNERKLLPPGGTLDFDYTGFGFFAVSPPPGVYEVQFRSRGVWEGRTLESPWVRFEIRPSR